MNKRAFLNNGNFEVVKELKQPQGTSSELSADFPKQNQPGFRRSAGSREGSRFLVYNWKLFA